MFRQFYIIEPRFFNMTSGMHRHHVDDRHLVIQLSFHSFMSVFPFTFKQVANNCSKAIFLLYVYILLCIHFSDLLHFYCSNITKFDRNDCHEILNSAVAPCSVSLHLPLESCTNFDITSLFCNTPQYFAWRVIHFWAWQDCFAVWFAKF